MKLSDILLHTRAITVTRPDWPEGSYLNMLNLRHGPDQQSHAVEMVALEDDEYSKYWIHVGLLLDDPYDGWVPLSQFHPQCYGKAPSPNRRFHGIVTPLGNVYPVRCYPWAPVPESSDLTFDKKHLEQLLHDTTANPTILSKADMYTNASDLFKQGYLLGADGWKKAGGSLSGVAKTLHFDEGELNTGDKVLITIDYAAGESTMEIFPAGQGQSSSLPDDFWAAPGPDQDLKNAYLKMAAEKEAQKAATPPAQKAEAVPNDMSSIQAALDALVEIVKENPKKVDPWYHTFVPSVAKQFSYKGTVTEKQFKYLKSAMDSLGDALPPAIKAILLELDE